MLDGGTSGQTAADEERSHSSHFLLKSSKFTQGSPTHWFRFRPDFGSFHFSVLQGNLVRILMLFHLPMTIFSSYQLTIGRDHTSTLSIAFAALSLITFSILIPILLIFRLFMNSTSKLYDETWTLLALGPLYNHYRHGSQLFACIFFATSLAMGVTIGCGQKSGIAQAVIILLIEITTALVTSIWLPWGHGASMGLISFLFCVARIVVAVLLVILTPTVSALRPHLASGHRLTPVCPGVHRDPSKPMGSLRYLAHHCYCLSGARSIVDHQDNRRSDSHYRWSWIRSQPPHCRQRTHRRLWSGGMLWISQAAEFSAPC